MRTLILVLAAAGALHADLVTLENTITLGFPLRILTGAAPVFGAGSGTVVADGFVAPVTAALDQISVAVGYQDFPSFGVTGRSPMLLTLFNDSGDLPGASIESWVVPVSPADTSVAVVTVTSTTNPLLRAGQQYWLSEVPTDPIHTGIGWGLALSSSGETLIQLPVTENTTGTNSGWGPAVLNVANEFDVVGTTVAPEPALLWVIVLLLLLMLVRLRIVSRREKGSETLQKSA